MWPTRLLRPWDFPGKSAGVGCHRLLWLKRTNFNQLLLVEAVIKMKPGPSVGDKDSDPLEKKHQWHLVRTWGMDIYNTYIMLTPSYSVWLFAALWTVACLAPCPWDFSGKNTGVGCHCLLQCMKVKSESEVAQSCPTLSNPMDCSLPGSSVHGIFQVNYSTVALISHASKVMVKILQARLQQYVNCELPDGDCTVWLKDAFSLEEAMTNPDNILKSRDITLPNTVHLVKAMVFPVVI